MVMIIGFTTKIVKTFVQHSLIQKILKLELIG
jgi:hypothetical protein